MSAIARMLDKARAAVLRRGVAPQDADDILQEAFARLEAYTRRHELRSREAFLITTAVNLSRDEARRRRRQPFATGEHDMAAFADRAPPPEEQLRAQERLRRAAAGLERLSPEVRRCLLAQRLEGLSFPEIAARERVSVSAVEKRVARAVMFLTKWMDGW